MSQYALIGKANKASAKIMAPKYMKSKILQISIFHDPKAVVRVLADNPPFDPL